MTLDGEPLRYGKVGVAGMRDFENPHFLAAGDPALLARLDLAALEPTARHERAARSSSRRRGSRITRCSIPATGESSSASAR